MKKCHQFLLLQLWLKFIDFTETLQQLKVWNGLGLLIISFTFVNFFFSFSKRKVLEAEKGSKVNEIVMQSEKNNSLYEGLSSNFFVIQNNSIVTAPEHAVLAGTIQQLVIQCCKSNNIPIIRDFPQVNELDQWEACFLTSTSRLLLPIDCIRVHESKKERNFDNQSSNLLKQLQDLLFQLLKQNSTRII